MQKRLVVHPVVERRVNKHKSWVVFIVLLVVSKNNKASKTILLEFIFIPPIYKYAIFLFYALIKAKIRSIKKVIINAQLLVLGVCYASFT